jgi:hypothetical protein
MNNEISIYNKVSDPLIFVQQMGSAIARSRLFGCESEDQGKIFAWYCVARQRDPFEVAAKHHIIDGNLSKKADAMLAEFRERGGKHLIISYTSELACLEYPPTLITSLDEVLFVVDFLSNSVSQSQDK